MKKHVALVAYVGNNKRNNKQRGVGMSCEEMTDTEINYCVATALGLNPDINGVSVFFLTHEGDIKWVDYCNNPSDAWLIIMENQITLFSPDYNKGDHDWRAELYDRDEGIFDFTCINPLRAAMIVFLMMRGEQCQKK